MSQLRRAVENLDTGEPVDEFRDETRRVAYFDEKNSQYFVEENGTRKYVGVGDIVSDYAWGIKYVPDGEMAEPAYRTLAKRILINETRRDLEKLRNDEMVVSHPTWFGAAYSFTIMWAHLKESWSNKDPEKK